MLRLSILAGVVSLGVVGLARSSANSALGDDSPHILYTAARSFDPLAWMRGADRFSLGATIFLRNAKGANPLVPDFAFTADPAVSFDGERVLFAARPKVKDAWQIWELSLAGGKPRRVSSGTEDCVRPFYLPEDRIVYARKVAGRFVVETMPLFGGKPLPLTYTPANSIPSDVLRDGRILFESEYAVASQMIPEIYTVYSDGSGVESYRCDHGSARHSARQSASGDIVFVSEPGLARFTSSRAKEIPLPAPAGEYAGNIAESRNGSWFVSWRPDEKSPFQLMDWIPGAASMTSVISEPGVNLVQPTVVLQRPVPNRHPTGLHDWPNANLLCLNAYTSKTHFAPGAIHSVRFYTRDDVGKSKLLGTAPVEPDGSFFVQVPTEQPLQVELLDSAGKTLQREAGFFWMRRGEQRACVGCHAGPETAPENAVPMILLKSTTPADMTGAVQSATGGH